MFRRDYVTPILEGARALESLKFREGDSVVITDKSGFYAYVDGWRGRCGGYDQGYVVVLVDQEEASGIVTKRFLVPEGELALAIKI